ncbi:DUF4194 domain-containing protein [Desulfofundulus sp. TPOSR]|uniref:DUF4194 domain-containing protein n=1 Tax=Desulfofundulus sp. TPOSR TaxID=2714340 RepID=UPI0014093BC2|nr:DUF4194 domain-containing protein [Desulfofundulus sp. TPOSR]NHM26407.1 DUF4194 domain-containing protein [Desulfofundulus sp. TPOSR]
MELLEQWNRLLPAEREEFTRVVNRLLSCTFITRKNEENRRDYYFIERHEDLLRAYLKLGGWSLEGDRAYGVYRVFSDFAYNRLRLKLEESIIILILRLCYEEKRRQINVTENIMITVREIQDKYAALKIRNRPIDKKTLRETMGLLKRFNILRVLDGEVTDPDCRLEVFPTILFALRVEDIRQVYEKLDTYRRAGAEEGLEEENGNIQ